MDINTWFTININLFIIYHFNPYLFYFASNSCRAHWYYTSRKCQKLFLLIMNRTTSPCKITAGKIMILSIENFATVNIKSYYYVFKFRCCNCSLSRKSFISWRLWKRLYLISPCFVLSNDDLAHLSRYLFKIV